MPGMIPSGRQADKDAVRGAPPLVNTLGQSFMRSPPSQTDPSRIGNPTGSPMLARQASRPTAPNRAYAKGGQVQRPFSGVNKPMVPVRGFAGGGLISGTAGYDYNAGGTPFGLPSAGPGQLGGNAMPSAAGSGSPPANPQGAGAGNGTYTSPTSNTPPAGGDYGWDNPMGSWPGMPAWGGADPQAQSGGFSRGGVIPSLDDGGEVPDTGGQDDGSVATGAGGSVDVASILGFGRQSMGLPADLTGSTQVAQNDAPAADGAPGHDPSQMNSLGFPTLSGQVTSSSDNTNTPEEDLDESLIPGANNLIGIGKSAGGLNAAGKIGKSFGLAAGGTVKSFEHGGDTTNPSGTPVTPPGANIVSFDDGGETPAIGGAAGGDMGNPAAAGQPAPPTPQPAPPSPQPGQAGQQGVLPSPGATPDAGMQAQVQQTKGLSQYLTGVGAMPPDQAQALLMSHGGDMDAALSSLGADKGAQFALMQYGRQQYNGLTSMAQAAMRDGTPEGKQKAAEALTQAHAMLPKSAGGGSQWKASGSGGFSVSSGAHSSVNSIIAGAKKGARPSKGKKQHSYDDGGSVIPGPGDVQDDDVTGTVTPDTSNSNDSAATEISAQQAQLYAAAKPYDFVAQHGLPTVLQSAANALTAPDGNTAGNAANTTANSEAATDPGWSAGHPDPGVNMGSSALDQLFQSVKDAQSKAAAQQPQPQPQAMGVGPEKPWVYDAGAVNIPAEGGFAGKSAMDINKAATSQFSLASQGAQRRAYVQAQEAPAQKLADSEALAGQKSSAAAARNSLTNETKVFIASLKGITDQQKAGVERAVSLINGGMDPTKAQQTVNSLAAQYGMQGAAFKAAVQQALAYQAQAGGRANAGAAPTAGPATGGAPPAHIIQGLKEGVPRALTAPDGSTQQWMLRNGQPVQVQ